MRFLVLITLLLAVLAGCLDNPPQTGTDYLASTLEEVHNYTNSTYNKLLKAPSLDPSDSKFKFGKAGNEELSKTINWFKQRETAEYEAAKNGSGEDKSTALSKVMMDFFLATSLYITADMSATIQTYSNDFDANSGIEIIGIASQISEKNYDYEKICNKMTTIYDTAAVEQSGFDKSSKNYQTLLNELNKQASLEQTRCAATLSEFTQFKRNSMKKSIAEGNSELSIIQAASMKFTDAIFESELK